MRAATAITALPGVGEAIGRRLARLGITTLRDLVFHFPRRYDDWSQTRPIKSLRIGATGVVIEAMIESITNAPSPRRRMTITKATLTDASGSLVATWFNQPFLLSTLRPGRTLYFRGSVGFDRNVGLKQLSNPAYETSPKIAAVYPETAGLSSKQLRLLIGRALTSVTDLASLVPGSIEADHQLTPYSSALQEIHQPTSLEAVGAARRRLAFEELFTFSLRLADLRQNLMIVPAPAIHTTPTDLQAFAQSLPFALTDNQRQASWEIIQDLGKAHPMNRLVEGDVGSGKTVVAAFAAYVAARAGFETVWMAPTEILARQHHQTLTSLLKPFDLSVGIWTGSQKDRPAGASVIVGTHALLHHLPDISRLGLVIIDEQHRFGVVQRATLRDPIIIDGQSLVPHFLSMTATPIPRTLALAIYGELAISQMRSRPTSRLSIKTRVVPPDKRLEAERFIAAQLTAGRQVFVVCPVIDEEETPAATLFESVRQRGVLVEYQRLQTVFPKQRLGLLHGRLKPKEKQAVMAAFAAGELDLLVATAVIEVGIDVPNATVMVIEDAEQFGLAQLHQLRGRVGRGAQQSFCFLMSDSHSPEALSRLAALEQTSDGFALAEIDLRLRGPGQIIGEHQSGLPEFRLASLMDFDLIRTARAAAETALRDQLIAPATMTALRASNRAEHLE